MDMAMVVDREREGKEAKQHDTLCRLLPVINRTSFFPSNADFDRNLQFGKNAGIGRLYLVLRCLISPRMLVFPGGFFPEIVGKGERLI